MFRERNLLSAGSFSFRKVFWSPEGTIANSRVRKALVSTHLFATESKGLRVVRI